MITFGQIIWIHYFPITEKRACPVHDFSFSSSLMMSVFCPRVGLKWMKSSYSKNKTKKHQGHFLNRLRPFKEEKTVFLVILTSKCSKICTHLAIKLMVATLLFPMQKANMATVWIWSVKSVFAILMQPKPISYMSCLLLYWVISRNHTNWLIQNGCTWELWHLWPHAQNKQNGLNRHGIWISSTQ